ncbi:hypothetical protein GOP47_0014106 [Adiantum capillus-veneris]|uniref:Uncharacterized protein n=1 Tax=Adiantum capillus-veneris TaxID=13818 RepID=A0A9D4UQ33_ADICA|nr:hypothetical protein GOP47_0014106 [Adiantum capillus-veneris]
MSRPLYCFYISLLHIAFSLLAQQATCNRHLTSLVPPTPLVLPYHNGPLLTGDSRSSLQVHLLWYGSFSPSQRSIVTDFFNSFREPTVNDHVVVPKQRTNKQHVVPSVWSWWKVVASYVDKNNASVANVVKLGKQFSDTTYSLGKNLKRVQMQALILKAIKSKSLPRGSGMTNLYFVLTASDVLVERFCMNSCGFHDYTRLPLEKSTTHGHLLSLPFAWVGNAATQCPGLCAWPFAIPQFGPPNPPLLSPNQDVGMDGMIINFATLLAGATTNPLGNGYFQGDASAPLEAATACIGSFGPGSYPGYPGKVQVDSKTKASFNAFGSRQRKYLLPALWNPLTLTCTTPQ